MAQDAQLLFKVVADEAIMGILAFELPEYHCVYVNKLARETLELLPDFSDLDLTLQSLFPTREVRGHMRPFSEDVLKHEGLMQDLVVRKANDSSFIANVGVKYVKPREGAEYLLLMLQDVTFQKKLQREVTAKQEEIKAAYEELLQQNQQLKELDLAKDKFIALTTHELRTPLSALVATTDVLAMKLYDTPEQQDEFIAILKEQSEHLMTLVNDILDFAKIRAGKMEYFIEHLPINQILARTTHDFSQQAEQTQVAMTVKVPEAEILCFYDQLRLREVLNNVVNNAIKYNRPHGTVEISVEANEERVRIAVKDTGVGIPADKLHHVFNEFETVGHVNKHQKGTGLGMPISKRLMQGLGGDLTLTSEEGVGTTFFIDIPTQRVLSDEVYRSRPDMSDDLAA